MKKLLFGVSMFILVLAACSPQALTEPQLQSTPTHIRPDAEETARAQLAQMLGRQVDDVRVVSRAQVEWPDACLGVVQQDVLCAQVITPGYIIILEANGQRYEYRTNADGSRIQPATLALTWKREGGIAGFCDHLTVYLSGEAYASSCGPQGGGTMGSLRALLSAAELAQFNRWLERFGQVSLDASTPPGVADGMTLLLTLDGLGSAQPNETEQGALFSFAQLLYERVK